MITWITNQVRGLHEDESGESSALSNVMLLAVAALAVVSLIAFGKKGMNFLTSFFTDNIDGKSSLDQ